MKVAIVGYGGMGQVIERLVEARGHSVVAKIDPSAPGATATVIDSTPIHGADVAIEFTHPQSAVTNLCALAKLEIPTVTGTTGWYDSLSLVRASFEESKTPLLYSANFSIGVNLFYAIVRNAAGLMNRFEEYDVWGSEIHHYNKVDSPSGTAKVLSGILCQELERKSTAVFQMLERKLRPEEFHFSSTRGGAVNFAHTIGFDSTADTITLTHAARNRDGYALGAIQGAEWLLGRSGVFTMEDFLGSVVS